MAEATQNTKGPRVVVHISQEMQFLLTQLAARLACNKKDLHNEVWRAGLKAHLGVTPEQIEEGTLTSLPRSTAATDAKTLTKQMMNGR
jgi:hypothetical protein